MSKDLRDVKIVVTDMDGTLLNSEGNVPSTFNDQVLALKENNVIMIIASGRQYHSLTQKFPSLTNDLYFIAENGAISFKGKEELFSFSIERSFVLETTAQIEKLEGMYAVVACKNSAYVTYSSQEFIDTIKPYYPSCKIVNSFEEIEEKEFLKIAICDFLGAEERGYDCFKHLIDGYQVTISGDVWIDISNKDANKGNALTKLLAQMNISSDEAMIFGDYMNDAQMMQCVYHSYAMENAHPELKKLANFFAPSNNENGVGQIIDKVLTAKQLK